MDSIDLTRRQILLSGAVSGLLGAGVTGSVGLSDITGESSIQAEQALELVGVTAGSADSDTSFTRVSDDDTTFGAAVELNNGDSSEILIDIHNNSSAALKTQATIKKPSSLSVSPRIADDDDLQGDNEVIQTGKDTYVFTIPAQRTIQFILTVSVPDTASSDASDVQMSFDPLSTSKDENPSTDSGPIITNAKLFDTVDSDGVVSAGETVRVEATVTEFNGLKSVETSAQEFDPNSNSEPITLTDDGPGVSQSDDKFSATFDVVSGAADGTEKTLDITATDNEGVTTEKTANSLVVKKLETDTNAPKITDATLSDVADSDGVVSDGEEVEVKATVKDATNAGEITKVTADASAFGAGKDVELSNTDTSNDAEADEGGEREVSTKFKVNEANANAKEGSQTVTVTAEDEEGTTTDKTTNSLEIDDDAPTVSDISLTDNTDEDGVVSTGDVVKVKAKVTDAETSQEITKITADAGDFGAGTVTLYDTDTDPPTGNSGGGTRTESATFTIGSNATEGTDQTITLTVEDENGDETTNVDAGKQPFSQTLEVDNDAPTIKSATLTDAPAPDSDGVVSDGEQVTVEATVEDATNAGEITKVTADASAFGAGTKVLSNTDTSDGAEASGGGEKTVSTTFTVDEANATDGTGKTVTVTATDENGNSAERDTGSLEIDNETPTISGVTLTDKADGDETVKSQETVRVTATVTDDDQINTVEADASSFDPTDGNPVTLTADGPGTSGEDTHGAEFTVGSNATDGNQSVTVTATDENDDESSTNSNSLTVDTSVPTINNVTLSSQSGIDGVADVGDTIRVTAEGVSETTTNVAEVKVSDNPFRDEQITLNDDGPGVDPDDNAYSEEFEVSSNATPGKSDTLTVTVTDEAGNTASETLGSNSLIIPPGTDELVSYWKLDDVKSGEVNVTDYIGSNTGTIEEDQGTPDNVSSTSIQATGTSAARFKHVPDANTGNVNNGYIDCGSDASLNVGNEFTVSAYFKPTDLSETDAALDEGIVSRDTGNVGSDERRWSLRVKEGTDKVIFAVQNESNGFKQAKTNKTIEDDAVYHAIGRFNGQDLDLSVKKIDSNGNVSDVDKANNSFPGSVNINTSDVPLRIGFYFADNARTMDGAINEVKLFNTRLSDSEVDDLHTITG